MADLTPRQQRWLDHLAELRDAYELYPPMRRLGEVLAGMGLPIPIPNAARTLSGARQPGSFGRGQRLGANARRIRRTGGHRRAT
jgi:hypothetical protein